ncbi:MAG: hypothetical protein ACREIC_24610 [Limisphaerales bacterium]
MNSRSLLSPARLTNVLFLFPVITLPKLFVNGQQWQGLQLNVEI